MKKQFGLFSVLVVCFLAAGAQQKAPPFWNEIQKFKEQDSLKTPPKNPIVFVGSSSFTMWKNVQQAFPNHTIINRGFGGSALPDVIRYEEETILKYKPKQVVIYVGENDFTLSDTVSAVDVFDRFKNLYNDIRNRFAKIPIAYISIKPSPSRQHLILKMVKANELIENFLCSQKNAAFIDVFHEMTDENGLPLKDIFIKDNLHMNEKGYAIWTRIIEPYLVK
jgi:lysophospholipase L1-like esterase